MENGEKKNWMYWGIFFATVLCVFLLGMLAASIMERRAESLVVFSPVKPIGDFEARNSVWGAAYPREYTSYIKTAQGDFKSKHNGNVLRDALEEDPKLVVLWAGYPFSRDYNQPRGHYNAVADIRNTLRTGSPKTKDDGPMPGTCWTCKSPDVPRMMQKDGVGNFYKATWASYGAEIVNPIGCADCHDPKTQDLTITRPALKEAFTRMGKDISKATHQEKRSLVCAQCHVEYYFKGPEKYLTFPWDQGMGVEEMEKYYDNANFSDWTHSLSRTPMLKAQHPDYETWRYGIHAKRGVSCADCHMPYVTEGGIKYTDHHIQSPLNNINRSCQVCHRESEEELKKNVYDNQDKVYELRMKAETQVVKAHIEAKAAWDKNATKEEMEPVLKLIRHAQWRLDYAIAGHGAAFHAPLEMSRILGTSIEKAIEARLLLARILAKYGVTGEIEMPDLATKEKAQKFVGIDIEKLRKEKQEFLQNVVPQWDKLAAEREKQTGK